MSNARTWLSILIVAAIASVSLGIAASRPSVTVGSHPRAAPPPPSPEATAAAAGLSASFEYAAQTIGPSVVTVRTTKEVRVSTSGQPFPRQFFFRSPFEDFFGEDFFERFEQLPAPSERRFQMGEGSGVVVREDGYILTNSHVVNGAEEVTVIFSDDRQYDAEVVGTDPKTDLAVIRIDATGLQAARLGDSDDLRVGEWVVAAGNPFGLSSSITTGIVSAKSRSHVGIADYEDFIQTDAAINRGNSGGPLVNLRGEVVGINTAIVSRTGGNVGIGFAIPINMAREVMDELIEGGRVVRGYLGVMIQDLSEGMATSFGYDSTDGALVSDVSDDGPALEAGLEPGDIITHFNGKPVTDITQLRLAVAAADPGSEVDLTIFRDGKSRTVDLVIAELPTETPSQPTTEGSDLSLGMTVETLTPSLAARLGLERDLDGVAVTGVEPFGPASRAGLRAGDVITHVQETPIDSAKAFRRELRRRDLGQGVRLAVRSRSQRRYVFLQLRK